MDTMTMGNLVGKVLDLIEQAEDFYTDPMTVEYGGSCCGNLVWGYKQGVAHQLVREVGFADYDNFVQVVQQRTSGRWVYLSGLMQFCTEVE